MHCSLSFCPLHDLPVPHPHCMPCTQVDSVIKGEFPVSRMEVVETMAYEVFHRENVLQVPQPFMAHAWSAPAHLLPSHLPSPPLPSPPLPHRLVMTMK